MALGGVTEGFSPLLANHSEDEILSALCALGMSWGSCGGLI